MTENASSNVLLRAHPPLEAQEGTSVSWSEKPYLFNELQVRELLAQQVKERLSTQPFLGRSGGPPVQIGLDLGLACVAMMLQFDILAEDEKARLVSRVNVLLRAHPPMGLPLEVQGGKDDV